jgi:hypothetical protein
MWLLKFAFCKCKMIKVSLKTPSCQCSRYITENDNTNGRVLMLYGWSDGMGVSDGLPMLLVIREQQILTPK